MCFEEVVGKATRDALEVVKERCVGVQKERENSESVAASCGCGYERFMWKLEPLVEGFLMVGEINEGTN